MAIFIISPTSQDTLGSQVPAAILRRRKNSGTSYSWAGAQKWSMDDMSYTPTHLDNLLVRVNGRTIFKDANPGRAKSCLI